MPVPRRAAAEVAAPATFRLGLAYVRQHPGLQLAVITVGVVMFLGGPVIQLAPVFARDTFGVDERAYGFLAAALGIGATAGSVVLGAYGDGVRRSPADRRRHRGLRRGRARHGA